MSHHDMIDMHITIREFTLIVIDKGDTSCMEGEIDECMTIHVDAFILLVSYKRFNLQWKL